MTKAGKLFADIVNNPKDVRFEDLDKVLKSHRFSRRNSKGDLVIILTSIQNSLIF